MRIAVIGATGQTGPHVVHGLIERGHEVIAVGRDAGRLAGCDTRARRMVAEATDIATLSIALADADAVACLAPHQLLHAVLAAMPSSCRRIVAAGSIRKYSRYGDAGARSARRVDAVMRASGRPGVVLNFSMIYGQPEDRTVNRMLALVRRSSVIPLPDGGRHMVQPIYIADMVAAVAAALERPEALGPSIDVAGPAPISYRAMVEACAAALSRKISILPLWSAPFVAGETMAGWFGATLPFIGEFARMAEDKHIDIADMRARLGVEPISFEEGLKRRLALRT